MAEKAVAELENKLLSLNLLFFNIKKIEFPASTPISSQASNDIRYATDCVTNILSNIVPHGYSNISVRRIGRGTSGRPRPVLVSLSSIEIVRDILRNKHKDTGPSRISQDDILQERKYLQDLKKKLRQTEGESLIIKYKNGRPILLNKKNITWIKNGGPPSLSTIRT